MFLINCQDTDSLNNAETDHNNVIQLEDSFNDRAASAYVSEGDAHASDSRNSEDHVTIVSEETEKIPDNDCQLHCYSNCEYGRVYDRNMVQCSTCMGWIHAVCSDAGEEARAIWNCSKCRTLPETVEDLKQQIIEVHSLLSDMIQKQGELYTNLGDILTKNHKLQMEVKELKKQNHDLRINQYNRLEASSSSSESDLSSNEDEESEGRAVSKAQKARRYGTVRNHINSSSNKPNKRVIHPNKPKEKPKITVLGGSMVRNSGPVISSVLKPTEYNSIVYSLSGLTIKEASKKAPSIFQEHADSDIAILQVGTSDFEKHSSVALVNQYEDLMW